MNKETIFGTGIFIIGLILSFFMVMESVHAYTYCINSSWIGENTTIINALTGATLLSLHEPNFCKYGCDSKLLQCNPSEWEVYTGPIGSLGIFGMVAVIIFIIIGLMYFASKR